MNTTTQPRASGDESQPVVGLPAAPQSQVEGQGVGQSGPARDRYFVGRKHRIVKSQIESSWWEVTDRTGRCVAAMRGRAEAAAICRRLNGGKR